MKVDLLLLLNLLICFFLNGKIENYLLSSKLDKMREFSTPYPSLPRKIVNID